ncbi:hypothetical protein WN55_00811 [Dufourea novaeangliae]|uniref:Uncharacterized protein n=1 Tax=Dufourea novaeangliae TaxID=178035 RepID=A0A154PEH4_DUFNO|nr:hypothetical protein WN55_00811 [Dufourea novaeangliae]
MGGEKRKKGTKRTKKKGERVRESKNQGKGVAGRGRWEVELVPGSTSKKRVGINELS